MTVEQISTGFRGSASYLSDIDYETIDYDNAYELMCNAVIATLPQNEMTNIKITMTVDGMSRHWGCRIDYKKLSEPLMCEYADG